MVVEQEVAARAGAGSTPGHTVHADALDHAVTAPGVYRLEARLDGYLWILTNPIHLR